MLDFLGGIGDTISKALGDTVSSVLDSFLYAVVYRVLYYITVALCWILKILYNVYGVFAGLSKVTYNGERDYLTNIFFNNTSINNVYWGMALIGIVMCFGFTIAAVMRKMFDGEGRLQTSMGHILTNMFKSSLIIVSLSFIMTVTMNATTVLLQRIEYLFNNASNIHQAQSIEFTDEQFATMARVLDTIGNYSLNPSYTSRYNINSCYNEIRPDLLILYQQGVFDFYYDVKDANNEKHASWQSELQKIVNAGNLTQDLKVDAYHDGVTDAIVGVMNTIRTDASFAPLQRFTRQYSAQEQVPLDRLVFLMASLRAAKNEAYNIDVTLTDPVRGPYYIGDKDIYSFSQVKDDFDIAPDKFDYLVAYLATIMLIIDIAGVILVCAARIFNLLTLYVVAPPFIAVMPLDDGGKFKQWTISFVVQCFGMFATVISMRIFLIFLPIVASSNLVLFDNVIMNLMAKLVLILGGGEAVTRANGMITGILADSAGYASINAGDVSGIGRSFASRGLKTAGGAGATLGYGAARTAVKGGWGVTKAGVKGGWLAAKTTGQGVYSLGSSIYNRFRGSGAETDKQKQQQQQTENQHQQDNPPKQQPSQELRQTTPSLAPNMRESINNPSAVSGGSSLPTGVNSGGPPDQQSASQFGGFGEGGGQGPGLRQAPVDNNGQTYGSLPRRHTVPDQRVSRQETGGQPAGNAKSPVSGAPSHGKEHLPDKAK